MENRAHALAAGLFAILMGAAFALALWWFSDAREPTRDYLLVSHTNINGLNEQANVRYRGIEAGKVTDIRLDPQDPRRILVRIAIRENLPLTRGTRASLGFQGVTGLAFVQLEDPGTDPRPLVAEGGALPELLLSPSPLSEITDVALDAMQRLRALSERISTVFDDENLARVNTTLERLEAAAGGMDRTFAEAPRTLAAVRRVLSEENVARLSSTLANLERTSAEAVPAVSELRGLIDNLQRVGSRLDETATAAGHGLIDTTLPQLNSLLKELNVTSRRMGRLIDEVEASPQMLLIGRGDTRAGPGEAGFDERLKELQ